MLDLFAFREFREGLAMMRDGDAEKAMTLLRQASERDPENPYYLSYYGLSLAYAEGKWADAERLCHTAVCRARRHAPAARAAIPAPVACAKPGSGPRPASSFELPAPQEVADGSRVAGLIAA